MVDEYAALAEPAGNTDLMMLLFQIRLVLGDDPAQAGLRIGSTQSPVDRPPVPTGNTSTLTS